jgi:WD40 repeat protein
LNYDADNVAIAGKNTLQVLKVGSTVVPTEDLLTSSYYMKNKKAIGTILDVKTGHGAYNKYIGTSTTTGSILIFNAGSKNKLLYRYAEQMRAVNTISFSQLDAHSLLSGSQDGAMKLWDLRSANGKPVLTIQSNTDAIRSIQFSPHHNRKFAAISDSGVILKWDLRLPAQFEKKFNAHTGPGLCLDWHPEFDYIVSAGRDKQVQVWNMNADSRVPEHVIYSASPVSKVSWRPISSNSISGAELAMSFLNNDLTVQVYSLRRKYIPLYTIESHQAQVTGLSFKDDRYLYTCSKDKFFCKEDLALQPHTIDNLPLTAVAWAPNNDFLFVDQQKKTADLEKESEHSTAAYPSQPMSTSPSSPANASGINSSSYLSHDSSPRPGMSRASSLRPGLNRGHSQNSHFHQSLAPVSVVNPNAVPVTLPIMKTESVLQYLADNYVFDSNEDLIGSCIKNSTTASEAGNHRDAQTWNVIKESLLWEQQLGEDIEYNDPPPVVGNDTVSMRSDSVHEKYHYSTSNSTNLGKSPTLSDLSEFNSLNSREQSMPNKEHRLSIIKSIKSKNSFSGIEESEEEESDHAKSLSRADVIKWSDKLRPKSADTTTDADDTITKDENEEAIEFTDTTTKPITLPHRKRSARNSLLEAVLPNESSPGARSSSPTYSLTSSMSGTSTSIRPLAAAWSTALNRQTLSKQTSHMSELTRQLTNQKLDDVGKEDKLVPPFAPRQMISKAVEFSSGQGDLIMSCTLLLLFNDKYHIFSDNMMKNYIYQYLEFLQRLRFWVTMTKILGSSKYEEFKQMSANSTTVRRFCSRCGVLVVNEITKEKFLKDPKVQFGAWFCEQCGCRSKCIYCNEPLKGLNIFRLKCGHNGHFGCFKSWVLDEGMDCCPGGC